MGSPCVLHLFGDHEGTVAMAAAEVARLEAAYSRYRPDSLLSRMNAAAAAGETVELEGEPAALLDYAWACHRRSGGLFDITTGVLGEAWDFRSGAVPTQDRIDRLLPRVGMDKLAWERPRLSFAVAGMALDLGGIVKEYAADQVAQLCQERGVRHGLVDLGGDLRVIGPQPDGSPWRVRIRDPRDPSRSCARIEIHSGGLATSGDYERFILIGGVRHGHILNPRTGWPVHGLASASVHAPTCLLAGSLATIALLRGSEGPGWLEGLGFPALTVDGDGRASAVGAGFMIGADVLAH